MVVRSLPLVVRFSSRETGPKPTKPKSQIIRGPKEHDLTSANSRPVSQAKGAHVSILSRFKQYICACLTLVALLPASVRAQEPNSSFEELRSSQRIKEGDSIKVIYRGGTTIQGRFEAISSNSLGLIANGTRHDIPETAVNEIRRRRPDPWWNGTLIGLGVGFAVGAVVAASQCENDPECQSLANLSFLPIFSGIGAAAGALIDFSIRRHETVFQASAVSHNHGPTISPILSKGQRGVRVSLSF